MDLEEAIDSDLDFLLVGCISGRKKDSMSEIWHVLIKYCRSKPQDFFELPIHGLFLIGLSFPVKKVIKRLRRVLMKNKFTFINCKKFTPIEKLVKSNPQEILEVIKPMLSRVPGKDTWRITVTKRHSSLNRSKMVDQIANLPTAPKGFVDLENPQWIINVEILGEWAGLSVFPSNTVLATHDFEKN